MNNNKELEQKGRSQKENSPMKKGSNIDDKKPQGEAEKKGKKKEEKRGSEEAMEAEDDVKNERIYQVNDIITILCDESRVIELYDPKFLKKALAQELFVKGIDPNLLTPHRLQNRFRESLTKDGLLIFYPSLTTSEILKIILKKSESTFYLSSCKGIGKSFALALFVYLLRQKKDSRVFYIHNPALFVTNSVSYFVNELYMAFPKEIEYLGYSKEKLSQMLNDKPTLEPGSPFKIFLSLLFERLAEMELEVYIIFDQVNELRKIQFTNKVAWTIFDQMRRPFIGKCKVILMSSLTNEMITKEVEQEFPNINITWKDPIQQAVEKYIKDRLTPILTNEKDKKAYKKIEVLTNGNFLFIHEFVGFYKPELPLEKNIKAFREKQLLSLNQEIFNFLAAEDATEGKAEVQKERRKKMTIILNSITNEIELAEPIIRRYYDARHFVYDLISRKMKPVHPLVMLAYRRAFSEVDFLKNMIKQFETNACVLGFILETIVLVTYPRSQLRRKLNLISMQDYKQKGQIDLTDYTEHYIINPGKFDLDEPGLYLPTIYNFALYDAFINDGNSIFALHITKHFGASKINDLVCESWKEDIQSPRRNTKLYVHQHLSQILQKTKKSLKTLLISIGQNPKTDPAFTTFGNMSNEKAKSFFYIDVTPILQILGFDLDLIKIMKNPAIRE